MSGIKGKLGFLVGMAAMDHAMMQQATPPTKTVCDPNARDKHRNKKAVRNYNVRRKV